jgi:hypothetical protein
MISTPWPVSSTRITAASSRRTRAGLLAHGFANDQRWTLGRIKTLIGKLFHIGYTVEGTGNLSHAEGDCSRGAAGTKKRDFERLSTEMQKALERFRDVVDKARARKMQRTTLHGSGCRAAYQLQRTNKHHVQHD